MNPNVLFILYCLIATPIFLSFKKISAYSVGEFIGIALIPAILVVIYNFKKNNKTLRIAASIIIVFWILMTVFSTLQDFKKLQAKQLHLKLPPVDYDPFASNQSAATGQTNRTLDVIDPYYNVATSRTKSSTRQEYISTLNRIMPDWQRIKDMPQFSQFLARADSVNMPLYRDLLIEADNNMDPVRVAQIYNVFKREYGIH